MVERYSASSYNEFVRQIQQIANIHQRVVVLFCGALDSDGISWCPDCRQAIPVIEDIIENPRIPNVSLGYLFVGIQRDEWKNMNNYYRTDAHLRLSNVPTLVCWERGKMVAKLIERECAVPQLVLPFFKSNYLI